jgi:hypothetical protein
VTGRDVTFSRSTPTQPMTMRTLLLTRCLSATVLPAFAQPGARQYKVLATFQTSTMEKEMNAAAGTGYVFATVSGAKGYQVTMTVGTAALGGHELVVLARRERN